MSLLSLVGQREKGNSYSETSGCDSSQLIVSGKREILDNVTETGNAFGRETSRY